MKPTPDLKSQFIETFNPQSPQQNNEKLIELCDFLDKRVYDRQVQKDCSLKTELIKNFVNVCNQGKVMKLNQNQIKMVESPHNNVPFKKTSSRNTIQEYKNSEQMAKNQRNNNRSLFEVSENFQVGSKELISSPFREIDSNYSNKQSVQSLSSLKNLEIQPACEQQRIRISLPQLDQSNPLNPVVLTGEGGNIRVITGHAKSAKNNSLKNAQNHSQCAAMFLPAGGLEQVPVKQTNFGYPEVATPQKSVSANPNRKLLYKNKSRSGSKVQSYHSVKQQNSSRQQITIAGVPQPISQLQSNITSSRGIEVLQEGQNVQYARKTSSSKFITASNAQSLQVQTSGNNLLPSQQRYQDIQKIYQKKSQQQNQQLLQHNQQSRSFASIPKSSLQEYQSLNYQSFKNIQTPEIYGSQGSQNYNTSQKVQNGVRINSMKNVHRNSQQLMRSSAQNGVGPIVSTQGIQKLSNVNTNNGHQLNALNAQQIQVKLDSKRGSTKGIEETRDSIKTTIKSTKLNLENYIQNNKKTSQEQYKFVVVEQNKSNGNQQVQPFLNRYQSQQKNSVQIKTQGQIYQVSNQIFNKQQQHRGIENQGQINYVSGQKLKQNGDKQVTSSLNQNRPRSQARNQKGLIVQNQTQNHTRNKLNNQQKTQLETYSQKYSKLTFQDQV